MGGETLAVTIWGMVPGIIIVSPFVTHEGSSTTQQVDIDTILVLCIGTGRNQRPIGHFMKPRVNSLPRLCRTTTRPLTTLEPRVGSTGHKSGTLDPPKMSMRLGGEPRKCA